MSIAFLRLLYFLFFIVASPLNCRYRMHVHMCVHTHIHLHIHTKHLNLNVLSLKPLLKSSYFPDTGISDGLWLVVQVWTHCQILNMMTVRNVHIT